MNPKARMNRRSKNPTVPSNVVGVIVESGASMIGRQHIRCSLKWIGTVFTFLVALVWVWSFLDTSIHDLGSHGRDHVRALQLVQGECLFTYDFYPAAPTTLLTDLIDLPWLKVNEDGVGLYLGLWKPWLIFAVPTGLLWHLDRRRYPPGHCTMCGYNLHGNVSGICPECGIDVGCQRK